MYRRKEENLIGPRPRRKGRRAAAVAALVALFGGSALPHLLAARLPAPSGPPADAILVLTGGENRIAEGYRAWREGKAAHLFILGTGKEATMERILPGSPDLAPAERERLHLEGWSENTMENAFSAKSAAVQHGFARVILVTSRYHLARAHLALRASLPAGVSISVIPVGSEWKGKSGRWRAARLYFIEGWKYWGYRLFLRWE
jgi:uncharacterized SAM-binding protein YcdF (DUF218 family)